MSTRRTAGTISSLSRNQLTGKKMTYMKESPMMRKKYYRYLGNQDYSVLLKSLVVLKTSESGRGVLLTVRMN